MTSFPGSPSSRRLSVLQLLPLLTFLTSKQPGLARTPVLQTSSGLAPHDSVEITFLSRIPCSCLLTKINPLLSFVTPQITRYSRFFGQAQLCLDARLISEVTQMKGIQPVLFHRSTPPLQDVRGVPWIRSGNNLYFLLLSLIIFQLNRSPDLLHSTVPQRVGIGKTEGWCSIAQEQKRW